jgi:cytochrome c-type protein NapB
VVPFPENHADYGVDICTSGHKSISSELPPTPELTATPGASPTPATPTGAAPPIPHELEGRADCLRCHDPSGNVRPAPPDHTGRPATVCQTCHQPASGVIPQPTAATAVPTATAPVLGMAPAIPHDLQGRENCLACHDPDGNVKPASPDHKGRPATVCQSCHQPGEEEDD